MSKLELVEIYDGITIEELAKRIGAEVSVVLNKLVVLGVKGLVPQSEVPIGTAKSVVNMFGYGVRYVSPPKCRNCNDLRDIIKMLERELKKVAPEMPGEDLPVVYAKFLQLAELWGDLRLNVTAVEDRFFFDLGAGGCVGQGATLGEALRELAKSSRGAGGHD